MKQQQTREQHRAAAEAVGDRAVEHWPAAIPRKYEGRIRLHLGRARSNTVASSGKGRHHHMQRGKPIAVAAAISDSGGTAGRARAGRRRRL